MATNVRVRCNVVVWAQQWVSGLRGEKEYRPWQWSSAAWGSMSFWPPLSTGSSSRRSQRIRLSSRRGPRRWCGFRLPLQPLQPRLPFRPIRRSAWWGRRPLRRRQMPRPRRPRPARRKRPRRPSRLSAVWFARPVRNGGRTTPGITDGVGVVVEPGAETGAALRTARAGGSESHCDNRLSSWSCPDGAAQSLSAALLRSHRAILDLCCATSGWARRVPRVLAWLEADAITSSSVWRLCDGWLVCG